jgi:uncharacterized SAM-binding protein YcdF (DUF218 family)
MFPSYGALGTTRPRFRTAVPNKNGRTTIQKILKALIVSLLCMLLMVYLVRRVGSFLVIDDPRKSDVILVLNGDTEDRPARALELLAQNFAPRVIFDVSAESRFYNRTHWELAEEYIQSLHLPMQSVSLCAIHGLSTKEEARDVAQCLATSSGNSVLLVTSDFHTRRALSTFRHEIPQRTFSVAAARTETEFGAEWWRHREWAKIAFDEWLRLIWWQAVDRWR